MAFQPKFRPDLKSFARTETDGRKIVVLRDPTSHKYFRLSDYEYRLLQKLDGTTTVDEAVKFLSDAGYSYSAEDVSKILARAAQAGLLLGTRFGTAAYQMDLKERIANAKKSQRLSSVYFLFIPVFNPDRFLERTLWFFRLICNKWTAAMVLLALPGAAYLLISGFSRIQNEFLFFFNLNNLLYLWVAIALTKLVHELAHAYTAKRFGLHVPEMGIAFLIFFPCLYCNTTDAWQLADRRQRIAIGAAGVTAEVAVAVLSLYIWYLTKPGILNSVVFYLMGVSLLSTVLFNANPLMKFDGYFIFSDFLGIPNLYRKSFEHIRFLFMNRVLGIVRIADSASSSREAAVFTVYGMSSFLYRIVLYTGIVGTVYYRFDKTVGILLAMLAAVLFVVRPIVKGVRTMVKYRREIRPRMSGVLVFSGVLALFLALVLVPVRRNSVYPCYLDSARKQRITVPFQTWIDKAYVTDGSMVKKGTILFALDTSMLKLTLLRQESKREVLKKELTLLLVDDDLMVQAPTKEVELREAVMEIARTQDLLAEASAGITAPFDGVVVDLDPRMKEGFQPGKGIVVGDLQSVKDCVVHALVPEAYVHTVRKGQLVRIWFPMEGSREFVRQVAGLKPFSERDLKNSPFSSRVGGELATEVDNSEQRDVPLESQYDCSVVFPNQKKKIPLGMTGRLVVQRPPKSIAMLVFDAIVRTFNRESLL